MGAPVVTQALAGVLAERGGANTSDRLAAALVADTPALARSYIDALRQCGVALEAIVDTHIPRAARRLGDLWVRDELGFAAVTLGMTRLTAIYRQLRPETVTRQAGPTSVRHALFALAPGETHALGVVMAADHFERNGWTVRVELTADADLLGRIARAHHFDLVGVSAACRRSIPTAAAALGSLRAASGPGVCAVIGGHLTTLEPEAAHATGADLAVGEAPSALAAVEARLTPAGPAHAIGA